MKHSTTYLKNNKIIRLVLPLCFWILIWELAASVIGMELLIPGPLAVASRFAELVCTGFFWKSAALSLARIFLGALAGITAGVLLAVLTARSALADMILSPAIRVIRAVPVASFIILVLLWVSKNRVPGVIAGLIVLPVIWESTSQGIRSIDPLLTELGSFYEMKQIRRWKYIYLPSIRPMFDAGLCTAIGLAWKSGVAAEVLCQPKYAIGTQIYQSKIYLETPSLFAWTIMVIIWSVLIERILTGFIRGKK